MLICAAGGLGGIFLSVLATRLLAQAWQDLRTARGIYTDGPVIAFACVLMFTAALVAGLLPALSTTSKTMMKGLQTSARTGASSVSRTALRKSLLTAEIGMTVVLLVAAGLLLKSFLRLRSADVGCVTRNVLTQQYGLPGKKYDTPEKVNAFNEKLLERVRAIPGVRAAALGNSLPGAGFWGDWVFTVKEHPPFKPGEDMPDALIRWADPGYFSALGIPLVSGRFFTSDDRVARSYKVILSRQLVHKYFANDNPIGEHLHVPAHFAVRARAWPGGERRGDAHPPVDALRHEASRSSRSLLGDCDAVGGRSAGLSGSRMACFPVRSDARAPKRVAPAHTEIDPQSASQLIPNRRGALAGSAQLTGKPEVNELVRYDEPKTEELPNEAR